MGVAAYLGIYLLIGMFLLVIGTWVFLAKMDFQEPEAIDTLKAAGGAARVLKAVGYLLAVASFIFTFLVSAAYLYTIINQSHSDVWVKDQPQIHRQIIIELGVLIILNGILGVLYKQHRRLSRVYWFCSGLMLSIVLIHGSISFIYGHSFLI